MSGPPVAILSALRSELAPLARSLRGARRLAGDRRFLRGELAGRPALLGWTGVGARAASAGAERALLHLDALGWQDCRVFVVGVAGGLSPSARTGEVFAFHRCRRFDAHDRETGRVELAAPAGASTAELLTVDRIVADASSKAELWQRLGAPERAAVDMETYYTAARCAAAGRQVVALRGISDGPADELPRWLAECADAERGLSQAKVAFRALATPSSVPLLFELRRRVALASERLGEVLRDLVAGS